MKIRMQLHNGTEQDRNVTFQFSDVSFRREEEGGAALKVPSHQIRLAWKWYGWIGLDEYKNRGWFNEFLNVVSIFIFWFNLSVRYIAKHDLRCMQFADSACKGIQRVTDNLLQQPLRISASLLQSAGRCLIAACKTFLFSRIFSILLAYLTPLAFCQNEADYL